MIVVLSVAVLVLGLMLVAAWALLVQLSAQHGRILMRLDALEEGAAPAEDSGVCGGGPADVPAELELNSPFPQFRLADLEGDAVALDDYAGTRVLLVNWSPACGFCDLIAPDLAKLHAPLRKQGTELVLITAGDADANRRLARKHGLKCPIVLKESGDSGTGFEGVGTPAAYLLDEQQRVASPRALGSEEVLALAREHAGMKLPLRLRAPRADRVKRDGLPAGTPAPDFSLKAINDEGTVRLRDFRGERVLLVFTDPHCAPCDELAPQLAQLHAQLGDDRLRMVMIGRGDVEENLAKCREHGIRFPVVLQHRSKLSRQYEVLRWPAAFLIDEQGRTADRVAVGGEAIMALARSGARVGEEAPITV